MSQQQAISEEKTTGGGQEPIAIVGIGCRLPGGADSPQRLWQLLSDSFDAITLVPADRFDADALYAEDPATPGKIMSRWGGFLEGIDRFDADFFNISPLEAERLDPQQRLLLEVAWEALEDAGIPAKTLAGTAVGVFVGMWLNDFEARLFTDHNKLDFYMTTGSGRYSASGRISYFFDFLGPSLTIDTAALHRWSPFIWRAKAFAAERVRWRWRVGPISFSNHTLRLPIRNRR
jgi:myxalamid-type polyketide synthase MxaE and MxaD